MTLAISSFQILLENFVRWYVRIEKFTFAHPLWLMSYSSRIFFSIRSHISTTDWTYLPNYFPFTTLGVSLAVQSHQRLPPCFFPKAKSFDPPTTIDLPATYLASSDGQICLQFGDGDLKKGKSKGSLSKVKSEILDPGRHCQPWWPRLARSISSCHLLRLLALYRYFVKIEALSWSSLRT